MDPGVAGVYGSHDPTDVSISLQDTFGPGMYDLTVVSLYADGNVNGDQSLPDLVITVIVTPEPAAVIGLGLGLAVLATLGRRART